MKVSQLLTGKPFSTEFGIVGYSTVVLVQDDGKNILYDCGPKGCALQLKAALADAGLEISDITDVVISHMHFDHVGNLPLFAEANLWMSETEWKTANENPDEWQSLPTCDYITNRCDVKFVKEGHKFTSSVEVIELPGHTEGLIGLKCGEDTILCSDALKNRYELWENIPLMSVDVDKSKKSIERIKTEAKIIYPGHDEKLYVDCPNNKEKIHFQIRFANGETLEI